MNTCIFPIEDVATDESSTSAKSIASDTSDTSKSSNTSVSSASSHSPRPSLIENLPFDILLHIVDHLDPPSIALFCQSSRALRAWSTHLTRGKDNNPRCWTYLERGHYKQCLDNKKQLCLTCREIESQTPHDMAKARKRTLNQAMHCSACKKDHPLLLFSAQQRLVKAKRRICLVQEASLPVCKHMKIQYKDLQGIRKRARHCYHHSHLIPTHRPQLFSPAAWLQRWKDRPGVRQSNTGVNVHRAHDLLVLKKGELPTLSSMNAALRKLQADGTFFLCPHREVDDVSVTTCNPDQCPCLVTESGGIYWPTGLHAQQQFGRQRHGSYMHDHDCFPLDWWFPSTKPAQEGYIDCQSPKSLSRKSKHVSCQKCCSSQTTIYSDPSNPLVVRISFKSWNSILRPSSHDGTSNTWDRFVDPESLGVLQDPESEHVFWCSDLNCKRYYRQPNLYQRFSNAVYRTVRLDQRCECKVPFWAMSPSQYNLRYDSKSGEKCLDGDTYYDGIQR